MYDSERTNGEHTPYWYDELSSSVEEALSDRTDGWPTRSVDLVVVGGGMSGLSVAYHAAKRGQSVVVIERGSLGSGETGRTTAHLSTALDDRYFNLERLHGAKGAQLAAASHAAAIDDIERIVRDEAIACGFRRIPGFLFSARPGRAGAKELLKERAAAQRAGVQVSLERESNLQLGDGACLRFERQADFQPLSYLAGLARVLKSLGARIITYTRVVDVDTDRSAPKITVEDGRSIAAKVVVVATNTPINDRLAMHTKQAAYRSYVLMFAISNGSVKPGLYWDTADPYHYLRLSSAGDRLIVGGADHRVGQSKAPEQHFGELEAWVRTKLPMAEAVVSRWSGQIQEPADGMAFIGRNPGAASNVFIVTGDSGNGITHAAIAGMLVNDLIGERPNPWAELYDPARKMPMAAASAFVRENAATGVHFADWIRKSDRADQPPQPGHGHVVRRGVRRIAVFVDEAGLSHEYSAMCPHLGCVVAWNAAERSWDCPCHGSRFDPYGRVMTGPAKSDLAQIERED